MPTRHPKVDAYIRGTPEWAAPILTSLRDTVHSACPAVEEELKWSRPAFMYRGRIMAGMAAFKNHVAFYFWNGSQVVEDRPDGSRGPTSQFGKLSSVKDLPPKKEIVALTKKAMALLEAGAKRERPPAKKKAPLAVPDYLAAALKKNRKANATFQAFSPSHQREYVEWITEAKGEDTRRRRMEQALEWMAEGKPRNWKYMKQ